MKLAAYEPSEKKTLQELHCAWCGCPAPAFERRVFWTCLPWHARLLVPVVGLVWRDYFSVDRELIRACGSVRSMGQLNEELAEYVVDHRNRGWWRRRARVRVSTQRLRRLARSHLAPQSATSPTEAAR
jgi:hypothetical protein